MRLVVCGPLGHLVKAFFSVQRERGPVGRPHFEENLAHFGPGVGQRLESRGEDSEASMSRRLAEAQLEISQAPK